MAKDNLPIGTILAFAGQKASLTAQTSNWLICDGSQFSKNQYPELYNVVQNLWGDFSGANNEHFKIPDLRGIFLRGVSGERVDKFKDPEAEARDYTFKSNEAGSFQQDSIKKHSHELKTLQVTNDLDGSVGPDGNSWNGYHKQSTKEEGTFETRPINAYVHYMIKAKDL